MKYVFKDPIFATVSTRIDVKKSRNSQDNALLPEQVEALIAACETEKERFITISLTFTGMRADELAHMRRAWIKQAYEHIQIPGIEGSWRPKTKAGARTIPLIEPRLRIVLKEWFLRYDGVNMDRSTIWRIINKVAKKAGIKPLYPHALRATFATFLAHKGISAASLCVVMGWNSIRTGEVYIQKTGVRADEEIREKWKP